MTLNLDCEHITAVLLADGWHTVTNKTFYVDDNYGFGTRGTDAAGQPAISNDLHIGDGFYLETIDQEFIAGPTTSLLAVKYG